MFLTGDVKNEEIAHLKKGSYIIIDDAACVVGDTQVSRPGKHGHAKVRLEAVGIIDGKKRVIVKPGHENVQVPIIGKKNAQILNVSGDTANVMDSETFETFDLKIPEELKGQVKEGMIALYWVVINDKIMKQVREGIE